MKKIMMILSCLVFCGLIAFCGYKFISHEKSQTAQIQELRGRVLFLEGLTADSTKGADFYRLCAKNAAGGGTATLL